MIKAILALSVSAASVTATLTSAEAGVLKFQCVDSEGPFSIIVDTNAKTVAAGDWLLSGRAVAITGNLISFTMDDDPTYRANLNRRTGVFRDTEGVVSTCSPAK
jgi:hypothetical protein